MKEKDTLRPGSRLMHLRAACINYIGRVRQNNEDCLCANEFFIIAEEMNSNIACFQERDCTQALYGVFDGVGGDAHGETASCAAAQFFSEQRQAALSACSNPNEMAALYRQANAAVNHAADGSCTTAVLLCITQSQAHVSNVGDSMAFLCRNGVLECLSQQHTEAPERPGDKPHVITHFLGESDCEQRYLPANAGPLPLEHGDLFLLCSDGITDMIDEQRLLSLLSQDAEESQIASDIINCAARAGGTDNATVVLVRVGLGTK